MSTGSDENPSSSASTTQAQKPLTGEEYRKYLERSGVIDSLKRILFTLHEEPEWPINPNEYVCEKLCDMCANPLVEKYKNDLQVAYGQIAQLEQIVANLKEELAKYKTIPASEASGLNTPDSQTASDISVNSTP